MDTRELIVVRGAGDLATGTICRLHRCGFRLLVLETARPRAIRRTVSLSEAVYEGSQTVEGTTCVLTDKIADCSALWQAGTVPLLVDPEGECIHHLHPLGIVDAILLKQRCRAQIANLRARPSGRRLSYSSKGWWIHGLVGSVSTV